VLFCKYLMKWPISPLLSLSPQDFWPPRTLNLIKQCWIMVWQNVQIIWWKKDNPLLRSIFKSML
jgi:hypothetical protein